MNMSKSKYYLPDPSHWPIVGSVGLFGIMFGAGNWLHHVWWGPWLFLLGIAVLIYMLFGWFGTVIKENQAGLLNDPQVDRSFRWGMCWFIFSEVMFFAVFFGALFFSRLLTIPRLGGAGTGALTHMMNYPNFTAHWPVLNNPDNTQFTAPKSVIYAWGLPAINTLILLTSSVTVTIAHWGVIKRHRFQAILFQGLTVLLGISFLAMQAKEYTEAYLEKGLTLGSGIFGTTFFMLTGFHALHVTLGTIMLAVIFIRICKHHFDPPHGHFGFEAVSWYWHFVDVVWLFLFVFVYWI